MLDGAAAASSKMLAKRFDTLGAGALEAHQAPSVGMMADRRGDLDDFAAQRARHIDRSSVDDGDAVAEVTDVIDAKAFNHGGVAPRGRIRYCRRRP